MPLSADNQGCLEQVVVFLGPQIIFVPFPNGSHEVAIEVGLGWDIKRLIADVIRWAGD